MDVTQKIISIVDDTRENVHFDGVWYTQFHTKTKNATFLMIWTKCNEIFGIFYGRAQLLV